MEFIPLTLNDEGLYPCSVLRLHKRQISEAFDSVTKPLFTYINVYNKQRPELSLDVIQDITRIYIQFLVGTLFNVLNTQTAECKPLVQEVQRLRDIMTAEFVEKLRNVRTRRLLWIDFVTLFLAIFGVCCNLIAVYLWNAAEKTLAQKLHELDGRVRF